MFDVEALIKYGGLFVVFLVVYGTTGLFFCFFIPTGAFLFATGLFAAAGSLNYNVFTICSFLVLASVLGNLTGYWFGKKTGPLLYKREDSRFFKKKHLATAESFYKKHGWLALTLGLYLPIIRTFAPIVAGMVRLNFRRFILLTVAGSVVWILSFVLAGYALGRIPALKPWLNYIVLVFILIVTVPLIIWVVKEFRKLKKENKVKK
ncbi:MAG: VTT domain-containing protein [Bacteroidia bacterium]|nr:VTT domain-containing protein [Bacteroidia bacterium]